MKKSLILICLIASGFMGFSQETIVVEAEKADVPEDWKERFFELTKEERLSLFADESVSIDEIHAIIEENRTQHSMNGSGGDDLFGCQLWYQHNPLEQEILDGTNWDLFDGGCGANQGVDAYSGPIQLDWDFCFMGTTFSQFYINTKGTLSFTAPICDWTPEDFPAADYSQIAGFWGDFDFTGVGLCYWELTEGAAIVTFLEVGHWVGGTACRNTMQMVITDGNSPILTPGYNVGLFYQNMDWAHGDVGGASCQQGPNPGVVGVDKQSGTDHIKIGSFNLVDASYNGPYGEPGGIDWLDNKNFFLKLCDDDGTFIDNHPPISSNHNGLLNGVWPSIACDTVTVCLNDSLPFEVLYLAPESGQQISLDYDLSDAPGFVPVTIEEGVVATFSGYFVGATEFVGVQSITITATDSGSPEGVTEQTFFIEVLDQEAPEIEVIGDLSICQGQSAELTVEPNDLDYYQWSTGCAGPTADCAISFGGWHTVTAWDGACSNTQEFFLNVITFTLPALSFTPEPPACFGEPLTVCIEEDFVDYSFECFDEDSYPCNFVSSDLNQQCVDVEPGTYVAVGEDENGCEARNIFVVAGASATLPEPFDASFCDGPEPVEFSGGFANPGSGNLLVYIADADCQFAEGSFLQVTIWPADGTDEFTIPLSMADACFWNNANNQQIELNFGDSISVEYISGPEDNGNNNISLFNCSSSNMVFNGAGTSGVLWSGMAECSIEPATGVWSQESCPCEGTFSNVNLYNNIFTPCDYGTYNLTFTEDNCGLSESYQLTFTEPIEDVLVIPNSAQILCPGEQIDLQVNYDAPTDCDIEISWSNADQGPNDDQASYTHPGSYENVSVIATVTNGCGSAQASVNVEAQVTPTANLEDQTLCDGTSANLDPINPDTPDLDYEWTQDGDPYSSDEEINTDESGIYTVVVSNDCGSANATANIIIASPFFADWNGDFILECDDGSVTVNITPSLPAGYSFIWENDPSITDQSFTIDDYGTDVITLLVTDSEGCDTYASSADVTIQDTGNLSPAPNPTDTVYICPNEVEKLDLNFGGCDAYNWYMVCPGVGDPVQLDGGQEIELSSAEFTDDCLDSYVFITGESADNQCCFVSETWTVLASLCPVTAPNVFTPNKDAFNNRFILEGIEVFDRTQLLVWNRWGTVIYESDDYQNDWTAPDAVEGTYFYVARMYDSTDTVIREIESNLTILR